MSDTQPSTPLDDAVEQILKRLLADVDDVMEFQGTIWKPNKDAERDVFIKLAKARDSINTLMDKAYAKQFLELPEMQDEPVNEVSSFAAESIEPQLRNHFRSLLRAAVNKMGA